MLKTKFADDNFKMLLTVLAILVTNILYHLTLALGINIQKMSPRLYSVANILKLSATVSHQHHIGKWYFQIMFVIVEKKLIWIVLKDIGYGGLDQYSKVYNRPR